MQEFSQVLGSEEGIEYWVRCSTGKKTSGEKAGHCDERRGMDRWQEVDTSVERRIAAATDRRSFSYA